MHKFYFYHKETGLLHASGFATTFADFGHARRLAQGHCPPDHLVHRSEHVLHERTHRYNFDTQNIESYDPGSFPAPPGHVWCLERLDWVPGPELLATQEAHRRLDHIMAHEHHHALRAALLHKEGALERLAALDEELRALQETISGTPVAT